MIAQSVYRKQETCLEIATNEIMITSETFDFNPNSRAIFDQRNISYLQKYYCPATVERQFQILCQDAHLSSITGLLEILSHEIACQWKVLTSRAEYLQYVLDSCEK